MSYTPEQIPSDLLRLTAAGTHVMEQVNNGNLFSEDADAKRHCVDAFDALAITLNRMPCFIRPHRNVLSASGYSGHGVAMATLAGKILAEAVAGQAERFDLMASLPRPRFPGGVALRWPMLVAAMTWYSMRDRLGL